jgi:plastocyanin
MENGRQGKSPIISVVPKREQFRATLAALAVAAGCAVNLSCGGGSSPPTEPTNPTLTNTITITASGASPLNIQVAPGTRVLFRNNDSRSHNMSSDPHPEHSDCTEINQVGLLAAGQARETGNLNSVRTCRFHDHDLPDSASLSGTILIR